MGDFSERMSAMAFDFKKEYKEFYLPKNKPQIVTVPPMNYIAVGAKAIPTRRAVPTKRPSACCTRLLTPSK